jgi:hypothetical protein
MMKTEATADELRFGQIAARHGFLSYCFLTDDILGSTGEIRDKIQQCRLEWKHQAEAGRKSGFIIAAISPALVSAAPDGSFLEFAANLASLYLLKAIKPDRIYLDTIRLAQPTDQRPTWEWLVGVNFFGAQADGRWWLDHRIPGGIAFSMNSVGHMVKAHLLADAMTDLSEAMGTEPEGPEATRISSLHRALTVAMHTIANAQAGPSGPSAALVRLDDPLGFRLRGRIDSPIPLREPRVLDGWRQDYNAARVPCGLGDGP